MDFEALIDCTRFFPAKTCINVDKISINSSAKPICTTKITNFCASEGSQRATRMIDGTSDGDFAEGGDYAAWPVHAKEFYEFMRPQASFWTLVDYQKKWIYIESLKKWIGADGTSDKETCEADTSITLSDTAGTDFLTVAEGDVTGGDINQCSNDRADVVALKAIINNVATANPTIFGVPADDTKTGTQRAEEMMDTFIAAMENWNGDDTKGENTQLQELQPAGDVPAGKIVSKKILCTLPVETSPSKNIF